MGEPWQWIATALVVSGAVFYLAWKLVLAPRRKSKRKGPDVPVDRLTRRR